MSFKTNRRQIRVGRVVGTGAFTLLFVGASLPSSVSAAPKASNQAQIALSIGESGENAYDDALAGKWNSLSRVAKRIALSTATLPAQWRPLRDQYHVSSRVSELQAAARSHNKWKAAEAANQVTLFAARLEEPTKPLIPTAITLLDVYGRELQIAVGQNDSGAARKTLGTLDSTWNQVRPRVVGARGTVAAKRFDGALRYAHVARFGSALAKASVSILDEVDVLEKVFTH
ncbi:hypothetical protein EON83_24975 [bacterium]|nr:MAG: hypothetical protein EON83_24975 [bacterium]